MTDQPRSLVSVEADLFGAIFGFHKKVMALVRESSLDEAKTAVVADRIKAMLDDITAEIKQTKRLNMAERLEAAFVDIQRLVQELSASQDGDKDKKAKAKPRRLKGRKA